MPPRYMYHFRLFLYMLKMYSYRIFDQRLLNLYIQVPSEAPQNTTAVNCEDYGSMLDVPLSHRCYCAQNVDTDAFIEYDQAVFCNLQPAFYWVALILLSAWAIFLFYVMADTADRYLVPALTITSDAIGLSPNVAGVTLLALANGAPDLFSAVAAFTGGTGSVDLGIGLLIGGAMFISTVVYGAVGITNPFDTYRRPFLRDLFFLFIAVLYLFLQLQQGQVTYTGSLGFLGIYAVYVLIVVVGRHVYQRHKRMKLEAAGISQASLLSAADNDIPNDSGLEENIDNITEWESGDANENEPGFDFIPPSLSHKRTSTVNSYMSQGNPNNPNNFNTPQNITITWADPHRQLIYVSKYLSKPVQSTLENTSKNTFKHCTSTRFTLGFDM